MNQIQQFNSNFGISESIKEEQQAFINRSHHLFEKIKDARSFFMDYRNLFEYVCIKIGQNPGVIIEKYPFYVGKIPPLEKIVPVNFMNTLKIWIFVRKFYSLNEFVENVDNFINECLNLAAVDLGIRYKDGMFYPSGEDVLDKDLIDFSLTVLNPFPAENEDLKLALTNYRQGNITAVIDKCYICIEGLTKHILNNKKNLIENKQDLLRKLNLSDRWKGILFNYLEFGNDHGRHANPNRHNVTEEEVEAFLYTTCLLIRLILRSKPV